MFTVRILDKKGNREIEKKSLNQITSRSTGYEYGTAIAEAIEEYVKTCKAILAEVINPDGHVIHRLAIVPKAGSVMVTENGANTLPLTYQFCQNKTALAEKYLIMVNPDKNNNKFYRMVDMGNHTWGAYYGRVGEQQGESPYSSHITRPFEYPDYMYAIKLQEKLLKGYKDKTVCHKTGAVKTHKEVKFCNISDPKVSELIEKLMACAKHVIAQNYTVTSNDVTPQMIIEAKRELNALRKAKKLKAFNNHLLELMHIIPRRIDGYGTYGVASMMAHATDDFCGIILREESLLDIMGGQVSVDEKRRQNENKPVDILEAMNIEIHVANQEQIQEVKQQLNNSLKHKLTGVYHVVNKRTQEAFDNYLRSQEEAGIKTAVRQFWHGSRNENWISILQNGLMLNPDAVITGKMFGNGIYFAPSAAKSWGYTSVGKWAGRGLNRTAPSVYMALYATAYGCPYEVFFHTRDWLHYDYQKLHHDHPGYSCVHAKAGKGMLHDDEVIFYREDQMTINYICEFAA